MISPGQLVHIHAITGHLLGLVLGVRPMEGAYRDSTGADPIYEITLLLDRDAPRWLGEGRIVAVADSICEVVR